MAYFRLICSFSSDLGVRVDAGFHVKVHEILLIETLRWICI